MKTRVLLQHPTLVEATTERRERREDLSRYRRYTVGMLHRYFRISLEIGKTAVGSRPAVLPCSRDLLSHDEL